MTTKILLALSLGALLAACSSDPGPGSPSTAAPATTEPTPAGDTAPEFAISCHGDLTKKGLAGLELTPRCVGGAPGTKCGDPCAAQDITITYVPPATRCGSVERFVWDGAACKKYLTNDGGEMHCKGADCERIFTTEALCQAAYETCPAK
jgi:hypothetical protein